MAVLLPILMGAAFLFGRYLYRRPNGSLELSAVTRQHIDLFQGGQLSETAVEAAKEQFRELLEVCEPTVPADHPFLAIFRNNYGECLTRLGAFEAAEAQLLKSQTVLEKKFGTATKKPARQVKRIAMIFRRLNCSIEAGLGFQISAEGRCAITLTRNAASITLRL